MAREALAVIQGSNYRGRLAERVVKIAHPACDGKIVSFLEGGYNLEALAACAVEHVKQLMI